jgi:2'-5' RNA ligase
VRLFVALNLPAAVRAAVWAATEPARRGDPPVKWVTSDGLHLTLKFLGEVVDERRAELEAALDRAAAGTRPLPVEVTGGGAFPDAARPRVLWVGIEAGPSLELLQHAVEREFAPLGFPIEGRPFRPHLTLGRAARTARAGELRPAAERLAALRFSATALIESVDLMRSTLRPSGASYDVVRRVALV